MNLEQQREAIQAFTKKMIETVEKKGNDYANQDRLSNFKNVGNFFDDTPQRICFEEMVKKMYRLKELLLFDKIPNNETIEDSLIDLANYSFLLSCILDEKNELQKTNSKNIATYVTNENTSCSVCDVPLVLGSNDIYSDDICSNSCYLQSINSRC